MKRVVADIEEVAINLGASDYREHSRRRAEFGPRLFQSRTFRIPEQRFGMARVWAKRRDAARHHQPVALSSPRSAFVGVAAMHNHGSVVERTVEEFLVRLDLHA